MAKKYKMASILNYTVYFYPEAKEGTQYRVYYNWTGDDPPAVHRKLVKKCSYFADCLYHIADIYGKQETEKGKDCT
jgi:hypothetical protein